MRFVLFLFLDSVYMGQDIKMRLSGQKRYDRNPGLLLEKNKLKSHFRQWLKWYVICAKLKMAVLLPTQNIPLPFNDGLSVTTHKIFPDSQIALATPLSFNKSHMFVKQSSCRFSLGKFNTLIIKYASSQNQPKPPKANQNYPKSPKSTNS